MLVNEVCKKCSLTKRAVEYYIEQGLIAPSVQENGYRDFSKEDVARLRKISILRGLDLSVADIREILSGQNTSLNEICRKKLMEINILQEKQRLMQELARTQDWEAVQEKLQHLQKKQSVLERLRNAFPGYYGNYICMHFAPYLDEPVQTEKQQEAFDTILAFLDIIHFEVPDELQAFYDGATAEFSDMAVCEKISSEINSAIGNFEKFVDTNREAVERYMAYKQTEEYKATPAYRMKETLKQFNSTSGYNDIFIPAMCRLSKKYQDYQTALQKANDEFLRMYPEWGRFDKA